MERFAKDKHSSLSETLINYGRKNNLKIGLCCQSYKELLLIPDSVPK